MAQFDFLPGDTILQLRELEDTLTTVQIPIFPLYNWFLNKKGSVHSEKGRKLT
jgi:hypothetical protein